MYFLALLFTLLGALPLSLSAQDGLEVQKRLLASPHQPIAKSAPLKAEAKSIPYNENFNDTVSWKDWSQINNQTWLSANDQDVWQRYEWGGPDYKGSATVYQNHGVGLNTWLISPALSLKEGMTYRVSFWFQSWFAPVHHVYLLTSPTDTVAGRIKVLDIVKDASTTDNFRADVEIQADGTYYLAFCDNTPYRENGTALRYSAAIDNVKVEVVSNNALPTAPMALTQVPGENGATSMSLKWKNPTRSKKGEQLDFLNYAKIFKDGKDSVVITDNVLPGAQMEWTDPNPTPGKHTYSVLVGNSTGDGDAATLNTYIGVDKAGAPENLSVDYDADAEIVTLDWDTPHFGMKGGWFDASGISYRVVRQPGNKVLANNLTTNEFEDDDLDNYGNYYYEVTTRTNAGLGGTAVSSSFLAGNVASLPVVQNWEDSTTYAAWQIVDNNADGSTLAVDHSNGYDSPSAIGWHFVGQNVDKTKDETLYAPPVELVAGKKYKVSCVVSNTPNYTFSLDITYGTEAAQAAQTNTILSYSGVSSDGSYAQIEETFEVSKSGRYYLAWWLHDTESNYVYFDDFRIEELLDNNLEATSVRNLNNTPSAGDKISTGVVYTNRGTTSAKSFTVQLLDNDNNVLGSSTVRRPLAAGATGTANIAWTVPDVEGTFAVRGKVLMSGDECANDDETVPVYLNVQGEGLRAVTIGTSSDVSENVPFKYYGRIVSESVYKAEDFQGMAGNIDSLSFKVRMGMERDFLNVPFKIFVANTDQPDLNTGWIQPTSMTKVFDGNIDLKTGVYDLTIPFSEPFCYTGGNLAVLVVGPEDGTLFSQEGGGMGAYVSEYGWGASRTYVSLSMAPAPDLNALNNEVGSYFSYVPNATFFFNPSNCGSLTGTVTDAEGNPVKGATVSGGEYSGFKNIKTTTDAEGKYFIKYFPAQTYDTQISATAKAYSDFSDYATIAEGDTTTLNITMKKCAVVRLSGKVTSATDNATPVLGATIAISGDNDLTTTTDAEGGYSLSGVYAQKNYTIKVTAPGYEVYDYYGGYPVIFDSADDSTATFDINLTPTTAAPYSAEAVDEGNKAVVTWQKPIENITLTKTSDKVVGQFGGAYNMYIGHRYTSAELKTLGVDSLYYIKAVKLVPMASSTFELAIWQGEEGNEERVYAQKFTPEKYGAWVTVDLSQPIKVDTEKSLVVGYTVESNVGAYPVGFDAGPVADGGDCLFDLTMNKWSTAREQLSSMNYNWAIKAVLGNDNNAREVAWATAPQSEAKVASAYNVIPLDSVPARLLTEAPAALATHYGVKMLSAAVRPLAPAKAEAINKIKGYNVYRLEPGQESQTWNWTLLNSEPVTTLSYTDAAWDSLENKPYRYAVRSFYGNPNTWGDGVLSDATFTDGVDKGRYGTLTVTVNADMGDAEGATVRLSDSNKVLSAKVAGGKATFSNVRFANYKLSVLKPLYDYYTKEISVSAKDAADTVTLAFHSKAPETLNATDYISEARLNWEAPTAAATAYLTASNDTMGNAFGLNAGTEYICGQMIAPSKMEAYAYNDFYIDRIEFYANAATTYSPLLWEGPDADHTVQVFRKDYTVSEDEVGTWTGLTLEKPIKIDPSKTYYVGYAVTSKTDEYPMAVDDNGYPAEGGCYMYGWDQMNTRYGWYFVQTVGNWMIRAHITDTPDSAKAKLGDVAYNLYRMKADDAANVAAWTKVNAAPIASTYYTDATWNDLADNTDYRYAVKSVFFDNTESAATFGKVMNKGALALLTAKVQTNNNLSAAGAVVRLHAGSLNYKAVVGSDGMAVVPEVVKGNGYEITVVKEGYDTLKVVSDIVSTFDTLTFQLAEVKPAPVGLTVQTAADNASVNINWLAPGSYVPKEGWAYWDTNEPYGGFGTSTGTGSVGQLYTPADQVEKGMKGLDITKIAFFTSDPSNNPVLDGAHWTVNIWRKTNGDNFEEVYSQEVENAKKPAWNEVALNTPYHVSGDETLLIGYTFYGSGSPFGIDAGPVVTGKTDWANFGQGWTSLASAVSGFNYNLLVHTYLEKAESASTAVAPAIAPAEKIGGEAAIAGGICPMKKAVAAKAAANHLRLAYAYPVKGYLVYRVAAGDENDESRWTALTASPINATSFVDDAWKSVEPGKQYLWAVKAAYVSGTSEAAFTETLNSDGTLGVDDITTNGFSVSKIADGTFEVTAPVAATLTVTSVAGAEVYSGSLEAGKNVVRIYAPQGIYLFGATATGFHQVKKVVVK